MQLSDKYLAKHKEDYASFGYKDREGTYSSPGIEIEFAEVYGHICRIEGHLQYIQHQIWQLETINTDISKLILQGFRDDYTETELKLKQIADENKI